MSRHSIKKRKTDERKRGLLYAFLLILFLLILEVTVYFRLHEQIHNANDQNQWYELHDMTREINKDLNSVVADLLYYTQGNLAREVLVNANHHSFIHLTDLMTHISLIQQKYDQIRLMDTLGNEVIRINRTSDGLVYTVADSVLQNKGDRYYFENSYALDTNEVYASRIDLNIEKGQIEFPFKPMIRFGIPIFNDENLKIGVGVINYLGGQIVTTLKTMNNHTGDQVYLISHDGYYIMGPDEQSEWGFMIPERKHRNLMNEHPTVWNHMQHNDSGKVQTKEGLFYYTHITFKPSTGHRMSVDGRSKLVMFVPKEEVHKSSSHLKMGLLAGFFGIAPLLILLGWKLGRSQVYQKWLFLKLEKEATHDHLTGLLNRKALMSHLKREMNLSRRTNTPLSLVFIDINDLKKMNDELGHDTGDKLIKSIAKSMMTTIRETDFAARIGGDEFAILLPDCPKSDTEAILHRMETCFEGLGLLFAQRRWSFSYGCTELKETDESPEDFINRADKKMYAHKLIQKKEKGATPR